jgi:hypothetical protein
MRTDTKHRTCTHKAAFNAAYRANGLLLLQPWWLDTRHFSSCHQPLTSGNAFLLLLLLQKEELLKLAVLPRLLQLIEGQAADSEAAYAAAGCLACLAQHPKWLAEISATGAVTNKVRLLPIIESTTVWQAAVRAGGLVGLHPAAGAYSAEQQQQQQRMHVAQARWLTGHRECLTAEVASFRAALQAVRRGSYSVNLARL